MTLKEKFKQWLDTEPRLQIREVQLEVIADEFAMDFANWCMDYKRIRRNSVGSIQYSKNDYDFAYTMEELLEIYKEEKGL